MSKIIDFFKPTKKKLNRVKPVYPPATLHPYPESLKDDAFVALDLETANSDYHSICQIGVAVFRGGKLTDYWVQLVNPQTYFSGVNIDIHGIEPGDVAGKPTLDEVWGTLEQYLTDIPCFTHTAFDRTAIERATVEYNLTYIEADWYDSSGLARRVWEDVAQKGYGLDNLCRKIGYELQHHDALEDAIGAGMVVLAAMARTETDLAGALKIAARRNVGPLQPGAAEVIKKKGNDINPEGSLVGNSVVFTGTLSKTRKTYIDVALKAGCKVANTVTKKTTLLVVGGDAEATNKYQRAMTLIEKGQAISIMDESQFLEII